MASTSSAIVWGDGDPEVVFLHGGGQNAHTWDSVVLALGRPALAIDLPGHGRSDRRDDRNYSPWHNAVAVAAAHGAARAARVRRGRHVARRRDHDSARRDPSGPRAARGDRRRHAAGERPEPPRTTAERGSTALIGGAADLRLVRGGDRGDSRARRPSERRHPCAAASVTTCTDATTASGRGGTTCSATIPTTPTKHRRRGRRRARLERLHTVVGRRVARSRCRRCVVQGGDSVFVAPRTAPSSNAGCRRRCGRSSRARGTPCRATSPTRSPRSSTSSSSRTRPARSRGRSSAHPPRTRVSAPHRDHRHAVARWARHPVAPRRAVPRPRDDRRG